MAGYDYNYGDYSTSKGTGPHINERSKRSYANDDECRTVIVDADGTQRTIVGCSPFQKPGTYVVKTETIIRERVHAPVFPSYKHGTPTKIEPVVKDYGFADDKWRRPSSPVKGYVYAADDKLRRPLSPVKGYVYAADDKLRRPSSPVHDYLQEVGDFLTKVQTEASHDQPTETPVFPSYKHRTPTKIEPVVKDYRFSVDKWRRPSSPVKGYVYAADDKLRRPSSPVKGYVYAADDKLRRPSSPVKGYVYAADDKLRRPSSPVHDYPQEVGDFLTKVQIGASRDQPTETPVFPSYKHNSPTKVVQPVKDYRYADDKWHRPSSPPKGYGYAADDHHKLRRPSSPVHDQTQASRDQPSRIGLFNGVNWRQPPQKTGHNGTTGYGDYSDYSNKTLYKPRNDDYDDYNRKKDSDKGLNMISNGDRAMPKTSTWAAHPVHDGRLSSATDDIETALRFLEESAKSSSVSTATPLSHYSAVPKQGEYPMEAGKRRVRFNLSP